MTNLQAWCLTAIRIEGPISHVGLREEVGGGISRINEACAYLVGAGYVEMGHASGLLDVTNKGRLRFSRLHGKAQSAAPWEGLAQQMQRRGRILG